MLTTTGRAAKCINCGQGFATVQDSIGHVHMTNTDTFTVYYNGGARKRQPTMSLALNSARVMEYMGMKRRLIMIGTPEGYVMPVSEILHGRNV